MTKAQQYRKTYYEKLISKFKSLKTDDVVTECYKGNKHEDIAEKFNIPIGLVHYLKQKWDRENLYGQHI